jgi:RimJ/RimL family protein N-acetyltransferase
MAIPGANTGSFTDPLRLKLVPMTEEHARQICRWRYEGEYAVYNAASWEEMAERGEEFADPDIRARQYFSAVDDNGELCGFAQFFPLVGVTRIGLGLRPDLCGRGLGSRFAAMIASEARRRKPGDEIDLEVFTWNRRAIRAYEKAGFVRTDTYVRPTPAGPAEFHCMVYRG